MRLPASNCATSVENDGVKQVNGLSTETVACDWSTSVENDGVKEFHNVACL